MRGVARVLLFASVVAASAVTGFYLSGSDRPADADSRVLLATSLPDLAGSNQNIGQWKGNVMLVNFWATWCAPCLEEIPHFVRMQDRLSQQGFQVIGIAVDEPEKVERFVGEHGINYPVLLGRLDAVELSRKMGNARGGLPFTLILDRGGEVVSVHPGAVTEEEVLLIVAKIL